MPNGTFAQLRLKTSPGSAIFGQDMLFDIPFLVDWNKIGELGQHQTGLNTKNKNSSCRDWDLKISDQYFFGKMVYSVNQKVSMKVILGLSIS